MKPIREWCEMCRDTVEWVEPRVVAAMTGKSRHTIANWMNRGLVHTLALPSRRRLACQRSVRVTGLPPDSREKDDENGGKGKSRRLTTSVRSKQNPADHVDRTDR